MIGGKVNSVVRVNLPDIVDRQDSYEHVQAYGISITTDKGQGTIIYRNNSNGYYGGYCVKGNHKKPQPIPVTTDVTWGEHDKE